MKNRILSVMVIVLFMFTSIVNSQNKNFIRAQPVEIFLGSTIFDPDSTEFKMIAVTQVWAGSRNNGTSHNNLITWLTDDYRKLWHKSADNEISDNWGGWNFVLSKDNLHYTFGYAKYKLSVGNKYIFLDYRDDRYGYYETFGNPFGHPADIMIRYDHNTEIFEVNSYYSADPPPGSWQKINNGDTIKIWELKEMGSPSTGKFEPYAPENLIYSYVNGKPKLSWQHHYPAEYYWIGYEIYRCITNNENPTNFIKIATVGKNTILIII